MKGFQLSCIIFVSLIIFTQCQNRNDFGASDTRPKSSLPTKVKFWLSSGQVYEDEIFKLVVVIKHPSERFDTKVKIELVKGDSSLYGVDSPMTLIFKKGYDAPKVLTLKSRGKKILKNKSKKIMFQITDVSGGEEASVDKNLSKFILKVKRKEKYGQSIIFPNLIGRELIDSLQYKFTPGKVLLYNEARKQLYEKIEVDKNNKITTIYAQYSIKIDTANGISSSFSKGVNTEHVFPRSKFTNNSQIGGDLFNLFASRIEVNSARSNYPFAEIDDVLADKWFYKGSTLSSIPIINKSDYCELDEGVAFEPSEKKKGDLARVIFYFFTIYNQYVDKVFFTEMKQTLINWHNIDKISIEEVERNNRIERVQGNNNPFLIDSTLVRRIFE